VNNKSRLQDQDAFDDEAAKKQLSQYGYNKLLLVEFKTSRPLQFVVHENNTIVWPHGSPQNCDEHVLIRQGQRCSCEWRVAFNHQCHHELCRNGKLDLSKYSTCWLNRKTFNSSVESFNQQIPQAEPQTIMGKDGGLSEDYGPCFPQGVAADNLHKVDTDNGATLVELAGNDGPTHHGKLTYQFVAEKATKLVGLAQSDQVILGLLCSLLDQLANWLWNSQSIEVQSYHTSAPSGLKNPTSRLVWGTLKAAPNTYNARYPGMRPDGKLCARKEIQCLVLLESPTPWNSFQNHVQRGKLVPFAGAQNITEDHAQKFTNTRSHHWPLIKT
jgi:hypothetical protein